MRRRASRAQHVPLVALTETRVRACVHARCRRTGWAACLAEGDGLVLVALLTGAGVGLTVGMLWHSAHSGGGWASWLSALP